MRLIFYRRIWFLCQEPVKTPIDAKERMRREIAARRNKLTAAQRVIKSADILEKLFGLDAMRAAKWVHFYVSHGGEVETTGMIAHALTNGKRVAVPIMDAAANRLILSELKDPARELVPRSQPPGRGIPEPKPEALRPVDAARMDLFVVPGLGFDPRGHRIGKGAGYYDRLLAEIPGRIPIVAPAFELQIVPEIPEDGHDIRVHWIVTEKRVIECGEPVTKGES